MISGVPVFAEMTSEKTSQGEVLSGHSDQGHSEKGHSAKGHNEPGTRHPAPGCAVEIGDKPGPIPYQSPPGPHTEASCDLGTVKKATMKKATVKMPQEATRHPVPGTRHRGVRQKSVTDPNLHPISLR